MRNLTKLLLMVCLVLNTSLAFALTTNEKTFFSAVEKGDLKTVQQLIDKVNLEATQDKDTALLVAANKGHRDILKLLLQHGANVNALDSYTNNALHMPIMNNDIEIVKILVKNGINVNNTNKSDMTPLYGVALNKRGEIAKILLDNGAKIRVKEGVINDLVIAAAGGSPEVVKLFIENGADINARDKRGETPILSASNPEVVQILADHGANLFVKDNYGNTPLISAAGTGKIELVQKFLDLKVDVKAKNSSGYTALDTAKRFGHKHIASLLQKYGVK